MTISMKDNCQIWQEKNRSSSAMEDERLHNITKEIRAGKAGLKGIFTPRQLNQIKSQVLSGQDVRFSTKEQALEFIERKFPNFEQEVAGSRSKQGWHFDSHPIDGSDEVVDHINIYSKELDFRVHITWGE